LKRLYDQGLLYKGYTIQPYSPAAGTGLSSHELNQPGCYRDVKDTSLTAQFAAIRNQASEFLFQAAAGAPVYLLAWTTTPWTLPSNSALTAGKNINYVLVKTFNPYTYLTVHVVLAKDLVKNYFQSAAENGDFEAYVSADKKPAAIPYHIVLECKGSDLEGIEYDQLMPYVQPKEAAFRVILGDFVTTEAGTGFVHIAPGHGEDDYHLGLANNVTIPETAGGDGTYVLSLVDGAVLPGGLSLDGDGRVRGTPTAPGRGTAARVRWAMPSVFTYVASFSV
jgi:isoleucyl-tRNA synthetase